MNILKKKLLLLLIIIYSITFLFSNTSSASFIKLIENDFLIKSGDSICFSYITSCSKLKLFVNEKFLKEIESNEFGIIDACIFLKEYGSYKIESICNYSSVYFYVNISDYSCENYPEKLKIIDIIIRNNTRQYEENNLKIVVKNLGCKGRAGILKIFVNNDLVDESRIYLIQNETKEIEKNIRFLDFGTNRIEILFSDDIYEKEIYVEKRNLSIFPILFVLLVFYFMVLFRRCDKFLALKIFLCFFVSSIVYIGYILDMLNIYLFTTEFSILLFSSLVLLLSLLKNTLIKKIDRKIVNKSENIKLFIISFAIIIFLTSLTKFVSKTQNTYWNVFYERQVRETFYNGFVPKFDDLSYLGREMSYPSGYFILKSSIIWLFNINYSYFSDIALEVLFNVMLIFSLIYLTRNLKVKYSLISRLIFILSFCSFVFIFTLLSAHLLHVPSISLLFYSLAILLERGVSKNKRTFLISFILFSASLIHPYSLVLYLVFYIFLIIVGEAEFNLRFLIPIFIASLPFFGKSYSSENVALAYLWGWFLNGGIVGTIREFSFLLPAVLMIIISDVSQFFMKRKVNGERKRRLIIEFLIISSIAAYAFISFRINIIAFFLMSFVLMDFLNEIKKNSKSFIKKFTFYLVLILVFANFSYSIYDITYGNNLGGYIDEPTITAIENLGSKGEFIKSDEKVIADPFLGHAITFISGKKVLADLYVEYADEIKINHSIEFSKKNDFSIADIYNITKALTKNSCSNWNQIYDNMAYKICEKSTN